MSKDEGLEYLLDLDGEILVQDAGYWAKIEARRLKKPSTECPHGIKYCLTLHDKFGRRVLGFDNAHPAMVKKAGRFSGRRLVYDHKHENSTGKIVPYVFGSAEQLVTDFFNDIDKVIKESK